MSTTNITGRAAITLAEAFGLTLNKHADPTDDGETRAAGISVDVAREVVKQDPALVFVTVAAVVAAHGEQEGREDYEARAVDVASGAEPESWAWPDTGADEAYINAVTTSAICEACGLDDESWDDISDAWCAAFKRGYASAHALAANT
jgi:hypothetical protein